MTQNSEFGPVIEMDAVRVTPQGVTPLRDAVAAEIPLTIVANGVELSTLLASPSYLKELTYGYLYTSGFITKADDVTAFFCDAERWTANVEMAQTPDSEAIRKRLYTSGCGKCAMYTTMSEISLRRPLENATRIRRQQVFDMALRVQEGTPAFHRTGSVHSAFLIERETGREIVMDDIARHNAMDKVVGKAVIEGFDFPGCICVRTGRTSAEIVYKTKRCGIPITIARGAPTHQAVHLAREMGITVIGFARKGSFNIYSGGERVVP